MAKHASARAPSQRQFRVGEVIRHALAEVFQEGIVHHPALGLVLTVPEVRMTPDLKLATVFVVSLGGKGADTLVATLDRHRKFLRGEVGHRVPCASRPNSASASTSPLTKASASIRCCARPTSSATSTRTSNSVP